MRDVMVDLETTGTRPDRSGVIQIGAVKFDIETMEIGPTFNRCPWALPHRDWDLDTFKWWMKQRAVLENIHARAEPPARVWQEFADWVGYDGARLWAKPISFEGPFLESHFKDLGIPNPFHYRNGVDLRTWMRARVNDMAFVEPELPFDGNVHDALDDCFHQLKIVATVKRMVS